jgi:hypothetical protein
MPVGELCTLIVFHGNRPAFEVTGAVANVHYPLVAIEFLEAEEGVAEAIRRIVDLNRIAGQSLNREIEPLHC